jgi:hypothetical protein
MHSLKRLSLQTTPPGRGTGRRFFSWLSSAELSNKLVSEKTLIYCFPPVYKRKIYAW